jgi:coenzyme PQQ precursor peptide PqqA
MPAAARDGGGGASQFNNRKKFKPWVMLPTSQFSSMRRLEMKWTKPAFKTLELASEVTAYRYAR